MTMQLVMQHPHLHACQACQAWKIDLSTASVILRDCLQNQTAVVAYQGISHQHMISTYRINLHLREHVDLACSAMLAVQCDVVRCMLLSMACSFILYHLAGKGSGVRL